MKENSDEYRHQPILESSTRSDCRSTHRGSGKLWLHGYYNRHEADTICSIRNSSDRRHSNDDMDRHYAKTHSKRKVPTSRLRGTRAPRRVSRPSPLTFCEQDESAGINSDNSDSDAARVIVTQPRRLSAASDRGVALFGGGNGHDSFRIQESGDRPG